MLSILWHDLKPAMRPSRTSRTSRASRFLAALIALLSMLFMQLALASYSCPGQSIGGGDLAHAAPAPGAGHMMESCADMDPVQPSLCHAYDLADRQSLDKPQLPNVQPFIATGLAQPLAEAVSVHFPESLLGARLRLIQGAAPPIAIRHCCLRI